MTKQSSVTAIEPAEFTETGSVVLSAKTGTKIKASVIGGDTTNTSIDLSVL